MPDDENQKRPHAHYFVSAVRDAVDAQQMTQQELADAMTGRGHRWHQATVYKVLSGSRRVTLEEAVDLAAILDEDLTTMAVPKHEANMRRSMVGANAALKNIADNTFRYLNHQHNVIQLLESRDDWDPITRETAEEWREPGRATGAVAEGGRRWEQNQSAWTAAEEINAEVEEARRRRDGEHPEASER